MSKWQRRTVYDRCYSSNSYPQKCEIYFQVKKLELNESACKRPLVETEHNSSWYEGIEGCGIQCENPIFTTVEHTRIHRFVGAFGSLSFICSLFTMVCHQPSLITVPSTRGVGTCLSFKLTFYDLNQIVNIFIIHLRIKISKKRHNVLMLSLILYIFFILSLDNDIMVTLISFIFFQITFLIGWKSQNRYPSVILFYMNACFCAASMGFLIQFTDGARNRTVCRKDDTMRLQEPRLIFNKNHVYSVP